MEPQHVKQDEHVNKKAVGSWRNVLDSQRFQGVYVLSNKARCERSML
jgi:hypothetical protein